MSRNTERRCSSLYADQAAGRKTREHIGDNAENTGRTL